MRVSALLRRRGVIAHVKMQRINGLLPGESLPFLYQETFYGAMVI
jgi:hypothetical protein